MATIDYSALGKAVQRLKEGLEALTREPENSLYRAPSSSASSSRTACARV
jgi:hypothetical protein